MRDYVNSGLLPSDCIHVKIHPNGNKEYCLWYPRLYADISYHETAYPNFPLPRLVFAFHADTEGKISGCRMGVIADERPTMETVMYRYPFSNVGGSMGTICIGRNALPQYKTPHALASLPTEAMNPIIIWLSAEVENYPITPFLSMQSTRKVCLSTTICNVTTVVCPLTRMSRNASK